MFLHVLASFETAFPLLLIITLTIYVTTDNVCSLKISVTSTSLRVKMMIILKDQSNIGKDKGKHLNIKLVERFKK